MTKLALDVRRRLTAGASLAASSRERPAGRLPRQPGERERPTAQALAEAPRARGGARARRRRRCSPKRPGHLTELARDAAAEGRLLVVVGGDGTLNEVVNGIVGTGAEIAVLPERHGPGLRADARHPDPVRRRRPRRAHRRAADGRPRPGDVRRRRRRARRRRIFANVGSVGMSGAVARAGERRCRRRSAAARRSTTRSSASSLRLAEHRGHGHLRRRRAPRADARRDRRERPLARRRDEARARRATPTTALFDVVLIGDVDEARLRHHLAEALQRRARRPPADRGAPRSATVDVDAARAAPARARRRGRPGRRRRGSRSCPGRCGCAFRLASSRCSLGVVAGSGGVAAASAGASAVVCGFAVERVRVAARASPAFSSAVEALLDRRRAARSIDLEARHEPSRPGP